MLKYKLAFLVVLAAILAVIGVRLAKGLSKQSLLDAQLASAVVRARSSISQFRDRLIHPQPTDRAYFLRAEFRRDDGNREYLWLNRVEATDGGFKAVVAEKPFVVDKVWQGESVVVPNADVVDWTITHQDGTREGNFTQGLEPTGH